MDRIAPKLVVALVILLLGALLWLQDARHSAERANTKATAYEDANKALVVSLVETDKERQRQEAQAVAALDRAEQGARRLAAVTTELKRLKTQHETLRAYLESGIPVGVERVLRAGPGQGAGDPGGTAGLSAEGDAEAAAPGTLSHEEGWHYCKALEVAIDNCNGDKAAARAWKEGRK